MNVYPSSRWSACALLATVPGLLPPLDVSTIDTFATAGSPVDAIEVGQGQPGGADTGGGQRGNGPASRASDRYTARTQSSGPARGKGLTKVLREPPEDLEPRRWTARATTWRTRTGAVPIPSYCA